MCCRPCRVSSRGLALDDVILKKRESYQRPCYRTRRKSCELRSRRLIPKRRSDKTRIARDSASSRRGKANKSDFTNWRRVERAGRARVTDDIAKLDRTQITSSMQKRALFPSRVLARLRVGRSVARKTVALYSRSAV